MEEKVAYQRLLEEVVRKFGRGVNCSSDYDELSASISAMTGKQLSPSTIKRLFGYVKYENIPRLSTLNILAQYIGYRDYQDFVEEGRSVSGQKNPRSQKSIYIVSAIAVLLIAIIGSIALWPDKLVIYDLDTPEIISQEDRTSALKKFREECVGMTMKECERIRSHREKMSDEEYKTYAYDEYIKFTFTDLKNHVNEGIHEIYPDNDEQASVYNAQIFSECQNIAIAVIRELYQPI